MRILVVDNDEAVLDVVCALLRGCGLEVQGAANPREACRLLAVGGWDALLSDFLFPGTIAGVAVAADARTRGVLCVIMSGAAEVEAAVTAQGLRFLAKPFSLTDLLAALGVSEAVPLTA
jgi:DNA-binding NtrC family response regulator